MLKSILHQAAKNWVVTTNTRTVFLVIFLGMTHVVELGITGQQGSAVPHRAALLVVRHDANVYRSWL